MKNIYYMLSLLVVFSVSSASAQIDLDFSHKRGFYSSTFELTISADDPDATIRYELGKNPDCPDTNSGTIYTGPITMVDNDDLNTLKVIAYNGNASETSKVYTHSYLFAPEVPTVVVSESPYEEASGENEKPISFEFIVPNDSPLKNVQEYAGSRESAGGISAGKSDKIYFRDAYGAGRLKEDLFSDFYYGIEPVENIDQLFLRADHSDNSYLRQIFSHDSELAMGNLAPHGRMVYFYELGSGKEMRHLHERPEAGFMDSYFGGGKENYEAFAGSIGSGGLDDIRDDINSFSKLDKYVNVQSLVDHLLICWYSSSWDYWSDRNWRVAGPKVFGQPDGIKYHFFVWDLDMGFKDSTTSDDTNNSPNNIVDDVEDDPDFVSFLSDRYHCTCENDGAFTKDRMIERLLIRYEELDEITDAYGISNPATSWKNDMVNSWIEDRHDSYKSTLQDTDLHSDIDAVKFNQYGGIMSANDQLVLDNPNGSGTIYYTIDGTDPRLPGGAINPNAIQYNGAVSLPEGVHDVFARVYSSSQQDIIDKWSPACPRKFYVDVDYDNVVINEIMYNPDSICAASDVSELDYIELTNTGVKAVNLANCDFNRGLTYVFPNPAIIQPGDYLVLAENPEEFEQAYGFAPFGKYKGQLSNDGEFVQISDPFQNIIDSVDYNDKKIWDELPDGNGPSIELLNPLSDNNDPINWFRSDDDCGTPGEENSRVCSGVADMIVINEINYNSDGDNLDPGDWVELYNPNSTPVDISDWIFYDNKNEFIFPAGTILQPDEYLVLVEDDALFSAAFPILTANQYIGNFDFGLSNKGERISLFDKNKCLSDYVVYNDKSPWDEEPDGDGPTLSLIVPNSDNALPESWESSSNIFSEYGTPGQKNAPCLLGSVTYPTNNCQNMPSLFVLDNFDPNVSYQWQFTGGTPSFASNQDSVEVVWSSPGTKSIQLISQDDECVRVQNYEIEICPLSDIYVMQEDSTLSSTLSTTSTSSNGLVSTTNNGTVTLSPDGSFTYVPNPDYFGPDSFMYETCETDVVNDTLIYTSVKNYSGQVMSGLDDIEEDAAGSITVNSDIDLKTGEFVGIRIQNINVPQGAIITNAYLQLVAEEAESGSTDISIDAESVGSSATIPTASGSLSSAPRTAASVTWNNVPAWSTDENYDSPDISTIVQELTDRNDWSSGNAMTFILSTTGSRTAQPYEDSPDFAAKLFVTYESLDSVVVVQNSTQTCAISIAEIEVVDVPDCIDIQLHAYLEGAYQPALNEMSTILSSLRKILPGQTPVSQLVTPTPAGQPYSVAPWNYTGTEGAGWTDADYTGDETDWVLVSFRTGTAKSTEVGMTAGLLQKDGSIEFPDRCALASNAASSLYVVVEHRNHIGVMTPQPIDVIASTLTFDFRSSESYRDPTSFGQKELPTGEWCLFAGDADQSDFPSFDIQGTDKAMWFGSNGVFDYYLAPDFNLDGDVNGQDKSLWYDNNGISSRVPK